MAVVGELIGLWMGLPTICLILPPVNEFAWFLFLCGAAYWVVLAMRSLIPCPLPAFGIRNAGLLGELISANEINEEALRDKSVANVRGALSRQLPGIDISRLSLLNDPDPRDRWLAWAIEYSVELSKQKPVHGAAVGAIRAYDRMTNDEHLDSLTRAILLTTMFVLARRHAPEMLAKRGPLWRERLAEIGEPLDFHCLAEAALNPETAGSPPAEASPYVRGAMLLMAAEEADDPDEAARLLDRHLEISGPSPSAAWFWRHLAPHVSSEQLLHSFEAMRPLLLPCLFVTESARRLNLRLVLDERDRLVVTQLKAAGQTVVYDLLELKPNVLRLEQSYRHERRFIGGGLTALGSVLIVVAVGFLKFGVGEEFAVGALYVGGGMIALGLVVGATLSESMFTLRFLDQRTDDALSVNPPTRRCQKEETIRFFRTAECALKSAHRRAEQARQAELPEQTEYRSRNSEES